MLTEPAFNALLKTLEEPPPHVIFVLATTEPQKIPETILSRCQRFHVRRLTVDEIVARLADLAERENLQFEPEALTAIARQATGSLRDAESLLDQLIAYSDETITRAQVQAILGTGSLRAVGDLVGCLASGDVAGGLDAINRAVDQGIAPGQLNRQVVEYLRGLMLLQVSGSDRLLDLAEETVQVMRDQAARMPFRQVMRSVRLFNEAGRALKGSLHPQLPLELAFIEAAALDLGETPVPRAQEATANVPAQPLDKPSAETPGTPSPAVPGQPSAASTGHDRPPPAEPGAGPAQESAAAGGLTVEAVRSEWGRLLQAIRARSRPLQALLRDSQVERVEGRTVVIGFKYTFHRDKVSETENCRVVEEAFEQLFGLPCRVVCEIISPQSARPDAARRPPPPSPEPPRAQGETGRSPAAAVESPSGKRYRVATQDPVVQAAVKELGAQVVDVKDE
jgi:DNA polymerase-3 subunit gamma/tau